MTVFTFYKLQTQVFVYVVQTVLLFVILLFDMMMCKCCPIM